MTGMFSVFRAYIPSLSQGPSLFVDALSTHARGTTKGGSLFLEDEAAILDDDADRQVHLDPVTRVIELALEHDP